MNLNQCDEAYQKDADFHRLVDLLSNAITALQYTPSEIRAAAMYAALRVEQYRGRCSFIVPKEDKEKEL